jgi:hypothetical protein
VSEKSGDIWGYLMSKLLGAAMLALIASAANAQTVYNTDLPSLNTGTATTTTDATGTRTTSTADSSASGAAGTWFQANVRPGGTVGITTDYAHDGNGSAYFATTGTGAKADLQMNFAQPVALSALQGVSFDYFVDASSTTSNILAPVVRFDIYKDSTWAGSLVLEPYYQNHAAITVGAWTTLSATLTDSTVWATKSVLGPTFAAADGGQKSYADWIADNAGSNLYVTGMSIGVGSGWTGSFKGAVDDVSIAFGGGPQATYNFEVASGAVPEPASWAMMLGGFGLVGGAMRRRKTAIRFA